MTLWSQRKPTMTEEGEAEFGVGTHPAETGIGVLGGFGDRLGAQVGELAALHRAPHLLDRVEVVAIGRKALDDEPMPLASDVGGHLLASVRHEAVPDHRGFGAVEVVS